jgi:hypothetical protein
MKALDDSRDAPEAWAACVHPADRRRVRDHMHRAARFGTSEVSYRLIGRDGATNMLRSRVAVGWGASGEMVVRGAGSLLDSRLGQ